MPKASAKVWGKSVASAQKGGAQPASQASQPARQFSQPAQPASQPASQASQLASQPASSASQPSQPPSQPARPASPASRVWTEIVDRSVGRFFAYQKLLFSASPCYDPSEKGPNRHQQRSIYSSALDMCFKVVEHTQKNNKIMEKKHDLVGRGIRRWDISYLSVLGWLVGRVSNFSTEL